MDVATGTGDFALAIRDAAARNGAAVKLLAVDSNKDMLALAVSKSKRVKAGGIRFALGDATSLDFPDRSFDVVACAFGLRNFGDVDLFAGETLRILKSGGRFVFLDLAMPEGALGRFLFGAYSRFMVLAGSLVDREAYEWLARSIMRFDRRNLASRMRTKGFRNVAVRSLFPGVAFIATGKKA